METTLFLITVILNLLAASIKSDERNTSGVIFHIFLVVIVSVYYYLSKTL